MLKSVTLCLLALLLLLRVPRTGALRLLATDEAARGVCPLSFTDSGLGKSSFSATFIVRVAVRVLSSGSASTVTRIFHGLRL